MHPGGLYSTLFEIGEQTLDNPIAGFKSRNFHDGDGDPLPNYVIASVPFTPSGRSGQELVFWVLTWMEDANGTLVGEMPGHGLKAVPGHGITNLLDPS